jgi:guanylate kinase
MNRGRILIISGPSGSGKSSIINYILSEVDNSTLSISTTSRDIRDGEIDGMDYNFVTKDEFQNMIEEKRFLEYENVHGNFYGTDKEFVEEALEFGKLLVFDVDTRGRESIMKFYSDIAVTLFVTTPSREILEERLRGRGTETEEQVQKRLQNAIEEMREMKNFDYFIVNDDLDRAKEEAIQVATLSALKPTISLSTAMLELWEM